MVHVQGTLCSWVHSNQLGPHAAPLKWLRMWPVQPSSLFRHNVYSFWRPVDAWEKSNVQYVGSKEQTDPSNVKRIKSNYCIVLEDNFHFKQVFTRIKFVHVHLGRKLPYSTLNYSLPNNLCIHMYTYTYLGRQLPYATSIHSNQVAAPLKFFFFFFDIPSSLLLGIDYHQMLSVQ